MVTLEEQQRSKAQVGESVLRTTIRCALHKSGFYGGVVRRKPLLNENHKKSCFQFPISHVGTTANVYKKTKQKKRCSSQTRPKLNLLAYVQKAMCGRNLHIDLNTPSCYEMAVAASCFADACPQQGQGGWSELMGKMDGAKCRTILEGNLLKAAKDLRLGWRFTFQQDNSPKHSARATTEWLTSKHTC